MLSAGVAVGNWTARAGGAVMAPFEPCLYSPAGQLMNGSMADDLVSMAAEIPDIAVAHVESPTADSELGAKGAGSPAAAMNAINDALRPLGAKIQHQPATPERLLAARGLR